jgi:hypothetical protein
VLGGLDENSDGSMLGNELGPALGSILGGKEGVPEGDELVIMKLVSGFVIDSCSMINPSCRRSPSNLPLEIASFVFLEAILGSIVEEG